MIASACRKHIGEASPALSPRGRRWLILVGRWCGREHPADEAMVQLLDLDGSQALDTQQCSQYTASRCATNDIEQFARLTMITFPIQSSQPPAHHLSHSFNTGHTFLPVSASKRLRTWSDTTARAPPPSIASKRNPRFEPSLLGMHSILESNKQTSENDQQAAFLHRRAVGRVKYIPRCSTTPRIARMRRANPASSWLLERRSRRRNSEAPISCRTSTRKAAVCS